MATSSRLEKVETYASAIKRKDALDQKATLVNAKSALSLLS